MNTKTITFGDLYDPKVFKFISRWKNRKLEKKWLHPSTRAKGMKVEVQVVITEV